MVINNPQPASLAGALLPWWDAHGRKDLPWQRDPTLYRVWVSEIMLQQTQVATVERYYERFLHDFPDVVALADATPDAVLHLWSGLGYYSRARNLHRAARRVRDEFGGVIPQSFPELLSLPGIGRSTAGAILALATGQRHAILDGNVRRVLSRVFRVESAPEHPSTQRRLWELAEASTPALRAAHYTQAIMDLGATVCTRRRPACTRCPLAGLCAAHRAGIAERLPAARARRLRPQRATVVLLVRDHAGRVLLEKRAESGLWGGLWGLPEIAAAEEASVWCLAQFGRLPVTSCELSGFRHAFTHFDLDITPVEVSIGTPSRAMEDGRWLWYNMRQPARVGLSAPVMKLLVAAQAAVDTWREP
jgi:A/G-specific adenine glycosylase